MKRSLTILAWLLLPFGSILYAQGGETDTLVVINEVDFIDRVNNALPFNVSGAVDAYYMYSGTGTPLPTSFTPDVNSFSLGMANLMFSKEGKVGFMMDLAVGPRAEAANGYGGSTLAAIKQLYITYSPADWLTFTLGNFGTFVGYEVIDAPGNINYSTSYLFSNGPFYHTGLKADFAFESGFGFMVGILDDTDAKFDEVPGKNFGAQLSYSGDKAGIYLNFLTGKSEDFPGSDPDLFSTQFDIVATLQATERLYFGLNGSIKTNSMDEADNTSWSGLALYSNYAFSDLFTLGARFEYFNDPDGLVLGMPDSDVIDLTLSGNFYIGNLTFIPEFRVDLASDDVFEDEDGDAVSNIPVFIMAAVYSF